LTGQWVEWTGYAYHVRRRLTKAEQSVVGAAVDLRGTPEAASRFEAVRALLPEPAVRLGLEEIGVVTA
jgi:hypothetical protein